MKKMRLFFQRFFSFCFLIALPPFLNAETSLSYFGNSYYNSDFQHFDYVNPDAPKGGRANLAAFGSFDSFNSFTLLGAIPAGLNELTFSSLMIPSMDEVESYYPGVATSYRINQEDTSIVFEIHPKAIFSDGTSITAHDIVFSFKAVQRHPNYKKILVDVLRAEVLTQRRVKFTFKHLKNKALPLLVAGLPILSKQHWEARGFESNFLIPPVTSGPYRIKIFKPGNYIIYERIQNWWAEALPVNKGRWNFNEIRYDYYRDTNALFEAFKAGNIDYNLENISQRWHLAYHFKAVTEGKIIKWEIKNNNPIGMQAIIFNMRHPYFKKIEIRRAFNACYNFAWLNQTYFYNSYERTRSFFENTALAATSLPSKAELEILEPYRGEIPNEVFTKVFSPPRGNQSGFIRDQRITAYELFKKAGWKIKDGVMLDEKSQPVIIEYLYYDKASDRILMPFIAQLAAFGIVLKPRFIEATQYINHLEIFDFEMTGFRFPATLIPGYEQQFIWGSASANQKGSWNFMGLKNQAVDDIIQKLLHAKNDEEMKNLARALDRILSWSSFIIPQWHLGAYRIAYWNRFGIPHTRPKYGIGFLDSWWVDEAKDPPLKRKG